MESFHIQKEKIKLQKNIAAFCYLERPKTKINVSKLVCPVQGPWITNRWRKAAERT